MGLKQSLTGICHCAFIRSIVTEAKSTFKFFFKAVDNYLTILLGFSYNTRVTLTKGTKMEDITITLSSLQARALRSAITWAEMLEANGEVELHPFLKFAFKEIKEQLEAPLKQVA